MKQDTQQGSIAGPAGTLETAVDGPAAEPRGTVVLCHPHPLFGGTLDNKVVQTMARAFLQLGWRTVRFNFRGVGGSAGAWDDGNGEVDDALAVIAHERTLHPALPVALGGFSFGGFVAAQAAHRLATATSISAPVQRLVLVAPASSRFPMPATVAPDTVLIHGESDDVVPLAAALDWARPQMLPVIVLPGVGHFFHGQLPLLKSQLVQALGG